MMTPCAVTSCTWDRVTNSRFDDSPAVACDRSELSLDAVWRDALRLRHGPGPLFVVVRIDESLAADDSALRSLGGAAPIHRLGRR